MPGPLFQHWPHPGKQGPRQFPKDLLKKTCAFVLF
jgi:hypothetical protein